MKLPQGLTTAEIRVLQEYRRLGVKEMSVEEIRAIKHPARVEEGEVMAGLAEKGFVSPDSGEGTFGLTGNGVEFLARNPEP